MSKFRLVCFHEKNFFLYITFILSGSSTAVTSYKIPQGTKTLKMYTVSHFESEKCRKSSLRWFWRTRQRPKLILTKLERLPLPWRLNKWLLKWHNLHKTSTHQSWAKEKITRYSSRSIHCQSNLSIAWKAFCLSQVSSSSPSLRSKNQARSSPRAKSKSLTLT